MSISSKKIIGLSFLALFLGCLTLPNSAFAATLSISTKNSTISTSESTTISAFIKGVQGRDVYFSSTPTRTFDPASCHVDNYGNTTTGDEGTCTTTFSSGAVGTYTITATEKYKGNIETTSASITIIVTNALNATVKTPVNINESTPITVTTSNQKSGIVILFTQPGGATLSGGTKCSNTSDASNLCCTTDSSGSCSNISFSSPTKGTYSVGFKDINGGYKAGAVSVNVGTAVSTQQEQTDYYPLAPLPGVGEKCQQDSTGKTICVKTATEGSTPSSGFANYLNVMINLFIGLCAVLAMIMIIMGGIQYMTSELISGKEAGKEQITHAVLGLLLALGAYAILNTINPDLLNISLNNLPTATITVTPILDTAQTIPANGQAYPYTSYKQGDTWPSDQTTRTALNNIQNVSIQQGPCAKVGSFNCTSVYGLNTAFVTKLHGQCINCKILITEGTAFWAHSANNLKVHYPNGFSVDLSETPTLKSELTSWTKTHFDKWFQNKGADCYYKNGMGLVDEGDHYHSFSLTGGCTTQGV